MVFLFYTILEVYTNFETVSHLPPERRKYFKRSRRLLLARMNSLSDDNKQAVNVMLGFSDGLTNAYLLKEEFYKFMDSNNSESARIQLKRFILLAQLHNLKEYKRCLTMLNNWKQYILNSFDYSYSNGYTEGINNKIKVHKRIAFGFKVFKNLRNRVLLEAYKTS